MRGRAGLAAALAALVATGAAPAAHLLPAERAALAALHRGVAAGAIDRPTATRARAEIHRAARLISSLPRGRREHVAVALDQIARFPGRLTGPRTIALIGQLKANDDYFARHAAPSAKTDITDADGIVYRYFAGRCFEFHPLAEFVMLNARISSGDADATRRLARGLIARGVHQLDGVAWEYYFAFGGGRAPWLSGMAQAMAAQAFARAAALLPDESPALLRAARSAYRPIPARLTTSVGAGPWIRLYGFAALRVLNAQLQTVVSLRGYAAKANDESAARLARSMQDATAATLPAFDTGYWTYYALPRHVSTLLYQDYVVDLLRKLAPLDPRFRDAAIRFASYRRQPPAFRLAEGGFGEVRFWLSKPARATVRSGARPPMRLSLGAGRHTLAWRPVRAGVFPVTVSAVDPAGNRASFQALPVVRVTGERARAARATAASPAGRPALLVGAGLDDPAQAARARRLGLRLVRIGVDWPTGAAAPELALAAAFRPLAGAAVLLELRLKRLPVDGFETAALAQYAAALAQQVPGIHDLTLAPAPTPESAAAYASALAAVRDAVRSALPAVAVGPLVDGGAAPRATVGALGPGLGAGADVVVFRPATVAAADAGTAAAVPELVSTLGQSFGAAPPVLLDGLATPTRIPADEVDAYPRTRHPEPDAVPAREQGRAYAATITDAACSSNLAGVVLDRLVDSAAVPAPSTGIAYASGRAKESARLVAAAAGPAQRGTVVCPGFASRAAASTLEFPTELDASRPAAVALACARDCLYLITLDDTRGRPVSARRGALRGAGRGPLTLELPKARLDRARYRLDVRLVDRVNPGKVTRRTSGLLPVTRT